MSYSFKEFQKQAIKKALELDKYNYIMKKVHECDVSKDEDFQRIFNGFYRVRRNEEWRKKFYEYFEEVKKYSEISFDTIVKDLLLRTGNLEASFSSKLLATINPNMPIWDQYVLKNLGLEIENQNRESKLTSILETYPKIIEKENKMLEQSDIKDVVKQLQEEFKEYKLPDIKVLDYILWSTREETNEE